jgi:hypothetical protein
MDEGILPFTESPIRLAEPRKAVMGVPLLVGLQRNYPLSIQYVTITRCHWPGYLG